MLGDWLPALGHSRRMSVLTRARVQPHFGHVSWENIGLALTPLSMKILLQQCRDRKGFGERLLPSPDRRFGRNLH